MTFLRWFLGERTPKEGTYRTQLDRFRDAQVDGDKQIQPPNVIYRFHAEKDKQMQGSNVTAFTRKARGK